MLEGCYDFLVAAVRCPVFGKDESSPEVLERFPWQLFYVKHVPYVKLSQIY